MFFEQTDVNFAAYADDNTLYFCGKNLEVLLSKLQICALKLFNGFQIIIWKWILTSVTLFLVRVMKIRKQNLTERLSQQYTQVQKLLGVHIDYKLKFDTHIEILCKKFGKKLHDFAKTIKFMSTSQTQLLMRSFIMSQFSYCALIWMCHNRRINNQINKWMCFETCLH